MNLGCSASAMLTLLEAAEQRRAGRRSPEAARCCRWGGAAWPPPVAGSFALGLWGPAARVRGRGKGRVGRSGGDGEDERTRGTARRRRSLETGVGEVRRWRVAGVVLPCVAACCGVEQRARAGKGAPGRGNASDNVYSGLCCFRGLPDCQKQMFY